MVSSTKPDEDHVLFWITEEDGREFATCAAAAFRAAMTERDELRAENKLLQLRGDIYLEQLQQKHAENERLRVELARWKPSECGRIYPVPVPGEVVKHCTREIDHDGPHQAGDAVWGWLARDKCR